MTANAARLFADARQAHQAGDFPSAQNLYNRALALAPADTSILLNAGALHLNHGHNREAAEFFARAIDAGKAPATALKALGFALSRAGRHIEALRPFNEYRAHAPNDHDIAPDYLRTLYTLARYDDIIAYVPAVPQDGPHAQIATVWAAEAEMALNNLPAATARLEAALEKWPAHIDLLPAMGKALQTARDFTRAAEIFTRATEIAPGEGMHWNNLATALRNLDRDDDALAALEKARALDPALAAATLVNESVIHKRRHDLARGIDAARAALALEPQNAHAHYALGTLLLMARDYRPAWPHIEWRFKRHDPALMPPPLPDRLWTGGDIAGKKLAVYADQGIGDTIQMLRYLPHLRQFNPATVTLYAQNKLARLVAANMPGIAFVAVDANGFRWRDAGPGIDALVAIGSLPAIFETGIDTIPVQPPLRAQAPHDYKKSPDDLVIGLSWHTKSLDAGYKRSLALDDFLFLRDIPGLRVVNLQYGDTAPARADAAAKGLHLIHDDTIDPWTDMQGFIDQIHACDLIVSIDNTTVHAAGAAGIPVWTILPYDPYWRWHLDTSASPWYPGMRLFRQMHRHDFTAPLAAVAEGLAQLRAGNRNLLLPMDFSAADATP